MPTTSRQLFFVSVTARQLFFFTGGDHVPTAVRLDSAAVGDARRLRFLLRLDGAAWDLSDVGDAVTLTLTRPDGTTLSAGMTAEAGGADGVFYYDTQPTDLNQRGEWAAGVTVNDGGVVRTYAGKIEMAVEDP